MLTRDKDFYRQFFQLLCMLVLQNVVVLSVNLLDNLMLGAYSETALAGAAAVNQLQFILQQIVMGIGDGIVVLGSQYWGQGRTEPIKKLSAIGLAAGLLVAGVLFLLVSAIPRGMLRLFTADDVIVDQGLAYLGILRFTYPFFTVTTILLATLRSVQTTVIAFLVSLNTLIVNGCLNYLLIAGHGGAPALGIRGAAIGTLTARVVECLLVLLFLARGDHKLRLLPRDYRHIDRPLLRDYVRVSTPIIVVAAMWGCSTALQTVILGHMEDGALAANSVAGTLFQILKVASVGAASAAAVVIGKTVGSGDLPKVRRYAHTLQVLFLAIGLLTSISLFLLRAPILGLYRLSPTTLQMADAFLLVLCVTCIGTSYQMPVLTGIVRGGGDTRFVMVNDLISIWGIVLPISFLAAFVFHWPPVAVVVCLNADQIFKCAAAAIKVNRFTWVRQLTAAEQP